MDRAVDGGVDARPVVRMNEPEEPGVVEGGRARGRRSRRSDHRGRGPGVEVQVPDADASGRQRDLEALAGLFERPPRLLGFDVGGGFRFARAGCAR